MILLSLIFSCFAMAREHPYFVGDIQISPNERYIAIGRLDYKVILYDLEEKKTIKAFAGKQGWEVNNDTFFTPDSKQWIIQDRSLLLKFWDIEKQEFVKEVKLESEANGLIFVRDGKGIVWGGADGRIEFIDLKTDERKVLKRPNLQRGFDQEIADLIISPDKKMFISVTEVSYYDEPSFKEPEEDFGPAWEGSKEIIAKHNGINLWDAETLTKIKKLQSKDTTGRAWATFSPDGKYVFTSYENGNVHQWDATEGSLVKEFSYYEAEGWCVGPVEGSSRWICGVRADLYFMDTLGKVKGEVDYNHGKEIRLGFLKRPLKYESVSFQLTTISSKNLIITGDRDGSISVYKFDPEKLTIELLWHPEPVKSGIITQINPLDVMYKSEEKARKEQQAYIEAQKKIGYGEKDKDETDLYGAGLSGKEK